LGVLVWVLVDLNLNGTRFFRMATELLSLNDGRTLEYRSNGVKSDSAIIFHQGTLADLIVWNSWLSVLADRGIRAVSFNRSGYGRSSGLDNRVVVDTAHDVAQVLDHLGLTNFVSIGWSGGGPPALATGLNDRCSGVVTLGGLAPFNEPDFDFYAGMKEGDILEYAAALRDMNELLELLGPNGPETTWCQPDLEALASPEAEELKSAIAATYETGLDCIVDDYSSYLSPWGFRVEEIGVPVVLFQGALDGNVPLGHGQWIARKIRNAQLVAKADEGHISIVFRYRQEILDTAGSLLTA
jgi:pimeloyl-ACP methyl ester carboxylesterase